MIAEKRCSGCKETKPKVGELSRPANAGDYEAVNLSTPGNVN